MIFEFTTTIFLTTPYFWVFVGLLFLLFEAGTPGLFYFLSFSVAAFCTAVATLFITTLLYQTLFFIVMTVVALILLRSLVASMLHRTDTYVSNVDALVHKQGRVVATITAHNSGQVNVAGEVWSARSNDGAVIEKDTNIVVLKVSGVHLIVKKIEV